MMNSATVPDKLSNMMRTMNILLLTLFLLQFLIVVVIVGLSMYWRYKHGHFDYIKISNTVSLTPRVESWFIAFLTEYAGWANVVPISLYVMTDILKLLMGWFMRKDELMRDEETKQYLDVRNTDLLEELG
jgi:magnesium-transporting ATPase (P-type)